MERDFLGLNSKESAAVKKEFADGGCEDSGFKKSSVVPLSDKVTVFPHFGPLKSERVALKTEQDETPSKMNSDLLTSLGYKNFRGPTMKQQFLTGNQVSAPHPLPSASAAGTTEQCVSAQLTIFYGGTVNVFDGISPEKAEAIMLLAGAGCIPGNLTRQNLHMQGAASKLPAADQALVDKNIQAGSDLPSPMSVSSHPSDHSGIPAASNNDVKGSKTVSMPTNHGTKVEPSKVISPMGSMAASAIMSSAVPLARKASLARFLEKRKERAINASPYSLSKNTDCATPESNGIGFSTISGASSCSISISKEISSDV